MQGHISQVNRFGLFLKSEGRKKGFKEKEIISCISRLHSRVDDARGARLEAEAPAERLVITVVVRNDDSPDWKVGTGCREEGSFEKH